MSNSEKIVALRTDLLRFACLQLSDSAIAEGAAHQDIKAALASTSFSGKGSLKNWVFAILRNKIVDLIREQHKVASESYIENSDSGLDSPFNDSGHWNKNPQTGNYPKAHWQISNLLIYSSSVLKSSLRTP